jgi:hypothetical protein
VAARSPIKNQGNHTGLPLQQTDKDDTDMVSVGAPDFYNFSLDKTDESWFNITIMKQINRKNTGNWWWPVEYNSGG